MYYVNYKDGTITELLCVTEEGPESGLLTGSPRTVLWKTLVIG